MGITNGYATLEEFKSEYEIDDFIDDAMIERAIEAASRLIDQLTWRRFYTTDEDEVRYYTADEGTRLFINDLISLTTLKTDEDADRVYETTWAATDFDLMPYNAALDGEPYTSIETTPNGDHNFTTVKRGVEITGQWGWSATAPSGIYQACLMATERQLKRKDTPLGVSASVASGQFAVIVSELKADPDFMRLVEPYIRRA